MSEKLLRDAIAFDSNVNSLLMAGIQFAGIDLASQKAMTIAQNLDIDALWGNIYKVLEAEYSKEEIEEIANLLMKLQEILATEFQTMASNIADHINDNNSPLIIAA